VEYAGGYTDMLAQRGADLRHSAIRPAAAAPSREENTSVARAAPGRVVQAAGQWTKSASPAVQNASAARRKLSFKDKHALEVLPGEIAALEAEIARLQTVMSEPELFTRDRATFDRTARALAGAQAELFAAEERWLELELLRSEVEDG
jgi:ATP-binding cassette subfamily F protein uup